MREPVISDEAYLRAIQEGRAAVAAHLGRLPEEGEGDVEGAETADRGAAASANPKGPKTPRVLLLRRQLVLTVDPTGPSPVSGEANGRPVATEAANAAESLSRVTAGVSTVAGSDHACQASDDVAAAGTAIGVTSRTVTDSDGDSDGDRRPACSAAGLLARRGLLVGAGVAIVAVAIAAVAEMTSNNLASPPSRRPAAASVERSATTVSHSSASQAKPKPPDTRAPRSTTTVITGSSVATTGPVVANNRQFTQSSANNAALNPTAGGGTGTSTGVTAPNNITYDRPGSTNSTSGGRDAPSTAGGHPYAATGGGYSGRRETAPGGTSVGGSGGPSVGNGSQPVDTSAGATHNGTGATNAGGIVSNGGG